MCAWNNLCAGAKGYVLLCIIILYMYIHVCVIIISKFDRIGPRSSAAYAAAVLFCLSEDNPRSGGALYRNEVSCNRFLMHTNLHVHVLLNTLV